MPLSNTITCIEPRAVSAECHGTSQLCRCGFIPVLAFLRDSYHRFWLDESPTRIYVTNNHGLKPLIIDHTMRKNLPKTLDQLIFCKYTLVFGKCSQIY